MLLVLPDLDAPATLILAPQDRLSDDDYFDFCAANPDVWLERTARGEIIIVPPVGGESAYRNTDVACQLGNWSKDTGHGKAFGPTAQVMLPDGSSLCPDAAWVSKERLAGLTREQLRRFPPLGSRIHC
jgi:Uma2 family endonuclease